MSTALPHPEGMSCFFQIITPLPSSQLWKSMKLQKMFRYKCHTGFQCSKLTQAPTPTVTPTPKIDIFWGQKFSAPTRRWRAHNSAEHFLDHTTLCSWRHSYNWLLIKLLGDSLHITHISHSPTRTSQKISMTHNKGTFWGKVVVFQPTQLGGSAAFSNEHSIAASRGNVLLFSNHNTLA